MIAVLKADYIPHRAGERAAAEGGDPKARVSQPLVPVITSPRCCSARLLGGAVLTEQVFTIPASGR